MKIEQIVQGLRSRAAQHDSQLAENDPSKGVLVAFDLIATALTLKHPSFKEEREWRIISKSLMDDPECDDQGQPVPEREPVPLDFREGKSGLIPFRRMPLRDHNHAFPLKEVVIGLCPDPDRSRRSVRSLLVNQYGDWARTGIKVRCSNIPYRYW